MHKLALILLLLSSSAFARELKGFVTDGCTYFPEGTGSRPNLWAECCHYHDMKYWIGGTHAEQDEADIILRECVREKANDFYAVLMYRGVRFGHYSPIKSKYRWGWGWHKKGYYGDLPPKDLMHAKQLILKSNVKKDLIERFIKQYIDPRNRL
tara:strand:+ start:7 stop:465 length:459 start_codon:yes stop_codon:yes gene_type:complete